MCKATKKNSENYVDGPEIPMGLGMALAKNIDAMNCFASMPELMKQQVIAHTHQIQSKREMEQYVESLTAGGFSGSNGSIG